MILLIKLIRVSTYQYFLSTFRLGTEAREILFLKAKKHIVQYLQYFCINFSSWDFLCSFFPFLGNGDIRICTAGTAANHNNPFLKDFQACSAYRKITAQVLHDNGFINSF